MQTKAVSTYIYHWVLAFRPKTLTQSLVPVFIGTWLAKGVKDPDWFITLFTALAAILVQIGVNLINDALDFKKGADTAARLGPSRAAQQGWFTAKQVLLGGFVAFALAAVCAIPLIFQGGPLVLATLIVILCCGYLYTGGPFPLAYYGLGDLFVVLFFGIISTTFVYFLQTETFGLDSLMAGLQIGFLSTALIAVNNLRDIEQDRQAQKKTLAVRFGKQFARWEITLLISFAYLLGLYWVFDGRWAAMVCPLATIPQAIKIIYNIWTHEPSKTFNEFFGATAFLHLSFGVLLGIGFQL